MDVSAGKQNFDLPRLTQANTFEQTGYGQNPLAKQNKHRLWTETKPRTKLKLTLKLHNQQNKNNNVHSNYKQPETR